MARLIGAATGLCATVLVSAGLMGAAAAQECTRRLLDKTYCDANGDLVADTPADPAKLVDPATLVFAYMSHPGR